MSHTTTLPYGDEQWRKLLDEVKELFQKGLYKKCSDRCVAALEQVRGPVRKDLACYLSLSSCYCLRPECDPQYPDSFPCSGSGFDTSYAQGSKLSNVEKPLCHTYHQENLYKVTDYDPGASVPPDISIVLCCNMHIHPGSTASSKESSEAGPFEAFIFILRKSRGIFDASQGAADNNI